MIDKLTAAQLRDLADLIWGKDLPTPPNYLGASVMLEIAEGLRNSAARREAVDFGEHGKCVEADKPCESDRCLTDRECYAPPPPADDLVARLRAMGFWKAVPNQVDKWIPDAVPLEAAAAIEALRAEVREMTALRDKWADATLAAEARVAALEGLLDKYRAGIVTHVQMNGPVFGGANSRQLKIAFEADQALAAGGGNG